jgi:uncharacterized membrane protein HdeD (DUF308 family)
MFAQADTHSGVGAPGGRITAASETSWKALVVRGVLAVLFGLLTIVLPRISLAALVLLFGAYAFAEGVTNLVGAVRGRGERPRWLLLVEGLVSVAVGVITLIMPGVTALALVYYIGVWAVVTGVLEVIAAIRLRKAVKGEWLLAASGILSVAFGVLVMLFPGAGALTLVLWIGAYALVFGAALIALGVRVRSLTSPHSPHHGGGLPAT